MSYLHIAKPLGDRRRNQHRHRLDDVGREEQRSELSFGEVELALEEVGDPGPASCQLLLPF